MNEVIQKVREKYPEYRDVDDLTLTDLIGEKYPQYLANESFRREYEGIQARSAEAAAMKTDRNRVFTSPEEPATEAAPVTNVAPVVEKPQPETPRFDFTMSLPATAPVDQMRGPTTISTQEPAKAQESFAEARKRSPDLQELIDEADPIEWLVTHGADALIRGGRRYFQAKDIQAIRRATNIDDEIKGAKQRLKQADDFFANEQYPTPNFTESDKAQYRQGMNRQRAEATRQVAMLTQERATLSERLPALVKDFAKQQSEIEQIPKTRAQAEFEKDETPWWKFFADPVELSLATTAESLPTMIEGMPGAVLGPGGLALAMGASSFGAESSARVVNAMQQNGVNLKDPVSVLGWFQDRAKSDPELAKADLAALGPAAFDALTAGIAGRWLKGAAGKGPKAMAIATAKEMGVQMAGGGAGSIAANLLVGEPIDWKDVVLEMAAELAPGEAVANYMEHKPADVRLAEENHLPATAKVLEEIGAPAPAEAPKITKEQLKEAVDTRLSELDEKYHGKWTVDKDGNPVRDRDTAVILTTAEKRERDWLTANASNHEAVAKRYGFEIVESGSIKDTAAEEPAKDATSEIKQKFERPKPIAVTERRDLEKRAAEAIEAGDQVKREALEKRLNRIIQDHQQVRKEMVEAISTGEKLRLEYELVDLENQLRRLAGEPELETSAPITDEDQRKSREWYENRAKEIQAKVDAGERLSDSDRQDWRISGRKESALPPPVPESSEAINKQIELAIDPNSTRAAVLITPGSPTPEVTPELEFVPTKHGEVYFNPTKTTREAVLKAAEGKDFDGTLLGMSQATKPEPVGNTVVQTTKDGVPVLDEVVAPTPEAIAKATEAHKTAVPGGETTVRPAEEILAERKESSQAAPDATEIQDKSKATDVAPVAPEDGSTSRPAGDTLGTGEVAPAADETPVLKSGIATPGEAARLDKELGGGGVRIGRDGKYEVIARVTEAKPGSPLDPNLYEGERETDVERFLRRIAGVEKLSEADRARAIELKERALGFNFPPVMTDAQKNLLSKTFNESGRIAKKAGMDAGALDEWVRVQLGKHPTVKLRQGATVESLAPKVESKGKQPTGAPRATAEAGVAQTSETFPGQAKETVTTPKGEAKANVESKPAPTAEKPKGLKGLSDTENVRLEELKAKLRKKLGQVGSGPDPEIITIGAEMAGLYVKSGVKQFGAFARQVKQDLPEIWDSLKQHLKSIWEAAAVDNPDIDEPSRAQVSDVLQAIDKETAQAQPATDEPLESRGDSAESADASATGDVEPTGDDRGGRLVGEQSGRSENVGEGREPAPTSDGRTGTDRSSPGPSQEQRTDRTGEPRDLRDVRRATADIVAPTNYVITDADKLGEGTIKTKVQDNLRAIRLVKQLEAEKRLPTQEEKAQLVRYVGWGGLKGVFDPGNKSFAKEFQTLRDTLTEEEYARARSSIQDAHYTSRTVIEHGIYAAMQRLGFRGGKMVEGGVGIGNFIGLLPESFRKNTSYLGVERDPVTAKIAQYLYPEAKILEMGFQDADLKRDSFDGAVGNPPFGAKSVFDKNYPESSKHSIHNYFIAKTLETVKPGGVAGFVVSRYFLDATDPAARKYISTLGEFLGAIRLPNTAFKENANTEVVTDLVFFKRVPEGTATNQDWIKTGIFQAGDDLKRNVNQWILDHPEMVLGNMTKAKHGLYAKEEMSVEPREGQDLAADLDRAVENLPKNVYEGTSRTTKERLTTPEDVTPVPDGVKVGNLYATERSIFKRMPDENAERKSVRLDVPEATVARLRGMIQVRDALNNLVRAELSTEKSAAEVEQLRQQLNETYDAFVKKYGYLNSQTNRRVFFEDADNMRVLGLERDYAQGISKETAKKKGIEPIPASAKKADIFTKRVNAPYQEITHVDTPKEALSVSLNQRGGVDLPHMADLTGLSEQEIINVLDGLIFQNPEGGWESKEKYLSGNVRAKLRAAEQQLAKTNDPAWQKNIDALKPVIPADIPATEIIAPVGAPWVDAKDVAKFATELTGAEPAAVLYQKANAGWLFKHNDESVASTEKWGTQRVPFGDLFKSMLNGKAIVVYDEARDSSGNTISVVNQPETELANARAAEIKEKWQDWLWQDKERRDRLHRIYNDNYNNYVDFKADGSHLTLPGASTAITLNPHQKNVVWRTVTNGAEGLLYDHVVGAGKTFAGVASMMELKRLGRVRKWLVGVPNHLTGQWADAFTQLYPNANILAAKASDFSKENRQKLFSKILTGDYDAVILGHSSLKKVGTSPEVEQGILQEMLDEIVETIDAMKKAEGKKGSRAISQMERTKDNLEAKLDKLADIDKRDTVASFEELGFDGMFIDEAHEFKNLFYTTQMQNVAGLGNPTGSAKAFDLYLKTRYLRNNYGGKAPIVFATGTPISNSLVEMFTMQRYLQPNVLNDMGLKTLDAWARVFADVRPVYEVDPTGTGYRMATRLANFQNVGELTSIYRNMADVITMNDLQAQAESAGKRFPVPKVKGGKPQNLVSERTPEQAAYFGEETPVLDEAGKPRVDNEGNPITAFPKGTILYRVDNLPTDPSIDNMLKITNDARKAGLDMRLVNPSAPDRPESKVNRAVAEITRIYKQWTPQRGTQLVFCDLSVPASARGRATKEAKSGGAGLYIRRGDKLEAIPKEEKAKAVTLEAAPNHEFFVREAARKHFIVAERSSGIAVGDGTTAAEAIAKAEKRIAQAGDIFPQQVQKHQPTPEMLAEFLASQAEPEATEEAEEATPDTGEKGVSVDELLADQSSFSVYDDMKAKLIAAGVPENEIAFIHDYNTPEAKMKLFRQMNAGEKRILFGSTPKLGAGTNVQRKLVALHHMDAPWRPSDLEQREGRAIRQGNEFYQASVEGYKTPQEYDTDPNSFSVEINRYATALTYDTRMWQLIEHKAAGIEGFRKADKTTRVIEDIGGEAANASDMKAAASGDPMIQQELQLRNEAKKLELLKRAWTNNRIDLQNREAYLRDYDVRFQSRMDELNRTQEVLKANTPLDEKGNPVFKFTLPDGTVTDEKGTALNYVVEQIKQGNRGYFGNYRGFDFSFEPFQTSGQVMGDDGQLKNVVVKGVTFYRGKGNYDFANRVTSFQGDERLTGQGLFQRFDNSFGDYADEVKRAEEKRDDAKKTLEEVRAELAKPFTKEAQLIEKKTEHEKVRTQLLNKKKQKAAPAPTEEDTQGAAATATPASIVPAAGSVPMLTPKSQRQIITDLAKGLNVPIRFGRLRTNKFAGYFQKMANLIGSKRANDMPVVSHEVGHKLDDLFGFASDPAVKAELMKLGDPSTPGSMSSWTPSKTVKYQLGEGVAEFVRYWLTDPAHAKTEAPQMFTAFEKVLNANKDVGDVMRTAQSDIDTWRKAEPQARLRSHISVGSNPNRTPYTFQQLMRDGVDDLHFLRMAVDDAEKSGVNLPPSQNPYLLARTLRGSYGMADSFIRNGVADFHSKKVQLGTSLQDALKPIAGRLMDFRDWIVAKRAQELHAQGRETGLIDSDVNETAKRFDGDAAFQEAFTKVKAWNDALLQYAVDAGLVPEESAEAMRKMNQDYVPFHRVFEVGAGEAPAVEGGGNGRGLNVGTPGSLKRLVGSTRDIIDPLETMVRNAYTLITAAEKSAINGAVADLSNLPNMGRWVEHIKTPQQQVTVGVEKLREQLKAAGADMTAVPDDLMLRFFQNSSRAPFGENVIKVVRNGEPQFYRLDRDLYATFHALDNDDANTLLKMLSAPSQLLRSGVTLAPDFALANAIRDAFSSAIVSRYGLLPFEGVIRGMKALAKNPELVAQWEAAGGKNSIEASYFDREKLQKFLAERISKDFTPAERALMVLKSPLQALRWLTSVSEEATRIGEFQKVYETLRKSGLPEGEAARMAAFESRDRQDFSKGGAKTKAVRRLTAFWNAALQGNVRLAQAFKERPIQTTLKGIAFITLPKLLEQAINWDDDDYWDRPQWERDLFFLFPIGKDAQGHTRFLRLPTPFEAGIIFGTLPGRILQAHKQQDNKAMKSFPLLVAQNALPNPMPQFGTVLFELLPPQGWDVFRGRQIVPDRVAQLPPSMQWTEQTSLTARKMGKLLGVSPMKVDHVINSTTGGVGKQSTHQIVDRAISMATGEERTAQGVVPGGRFATTPAAVSSQAIEDFYKTLADIKTARAGFKKEGAPSDLLRWGPRFLATEKRMSALRKQMRSAGTEAERDAAGEQILTIARQTMDAFNKQQRKR